MKMIYLGFYCNIEKAIKPIIGTQKLAESLKLFQIDLEVNDVQKDILNGLWVAYSKCSLKLFWDPKFMEKCIEFFKWREKFTWITMTSSSNTDSDKLQEEILVLKTEKVFV